MTKDATDGPSVSTPPHAPAAPDTPGHDDLLPNIIPYGSVSLLSGAGA